MPPKVVEHFVHTLFIFLFLWSFRHTILLLSLAQFFCRLKEFGYNGKSCKLSSLKAHLAYQPSYFSRVCVQTRIILDTVPTFHFFPLYKNQYYTFTTFLVSSFTQKLFHFTYNSPHIPSARFDGETGTTGKHQGLPIFPYHFPKEHYIFYNYLVSLWKKVIEMREEGETRL